MRSKLLIFGLVWVAVVAVSLLFPAHAKDHVVDAQHATLELISEFDTVAPGQEFYLGVRVTLEEGWHIYWRNPGDTGLPTRVTWDAPGELEVGPILWPSPIRFKLENFINFGYEDAVTFPFLVKTSELATLSTTAVEANVSWLICKDLCIPGDAQLSMDLNVGKTPMYSSEERHLTTVVGKLPMEAGDNGFRSVVTQDGRWSLDLSYLDFPISSAQFFPDYSDTISYGAQQTLESNSSGLSLRGELSADYKNSVNEFAGTLVVKNEVNREVQSYDLTRVPEQKTSLERSISPHEESQTISSLWLAICFALIGGVILNLMPCVLPVLAIKLMSLIEHGEQSRRLRFRETFLFSAGVVLTFCVIGATLILLRSAGEQIGWGFQLQSPETVLTLIILFFALSLNMSGLFEIGTSLQRFGGMKNTFGRWSSFASGALVTIIATPCTAPFMGAAIGFSIAQGTLASMLTFFALGVGMATPYALISLRPGLLKWLPKPGEWMNTLKNLLSLPLYLTVVWLIWVLGQQTNIHIVSQVLVLMVFTGLSAWAIGKVQYGRVSRIHAWRGLVAVSALISVLGLAYVLTSFDNSPGENNTDLNWEVWSADSVLEARKDGQSVFVDYTAAWCITCQVNKALVLDDQDVLRTFEENKVLMFRADWTSRDPSITQSLTGLGRSGVPVYVYYPPDNGVPLLLSEILTKKEIFALFD